MTEANSNNQAEDADEAPQPPVQEKFALSIYEYLEQSQSSHGISHEDYIQYAQYCTNRLSRLRHNRDVLKQCVHNGKYAEGGSKSSGRRGKHAYCSRDRLPEPIVSHENFVWILLVNSERCWTQALQHQREDAEQAEGNKRKSKQQQKILKRLRKALKYATELQELAERACTDKTLLECQAYRHWMNGNYALQKKNYKEALDAYTQCMNLLIQLARTANTDSDADDAKQLLLSDLWTTRAENTVRPLVRYCQYECKDYTPIATAGTTSTTTTTTNENSILVSYRGHNIALDSYKNLCVLYLKVEGLLQKHKESCDSDNNDQQFLSILSIVDDANTYIGKEFTKYQSLSAAGASTSGPALKAKLYELQCLRGYFQHIKLSLLMTKNEQRLKLECSTDGEYLHIYDTLLQNANQILALPNPTQIKKQQEKDGAGDANTSEAAVHDDDNIVHDEFYEAAYASLLRIRAFRCYYLSKLYATSNDLSREAYALLKQTKTLIKRAIEEIGAIDETEEGEKQIDELEELLNNQVNALMCRVQATLYLSTVGINDAGSSSGSKPLLLRLDEPDGNGPLVNENCPIDLIPIPCKPAFYDLAYGYIDDEETKTMNVISNYINNLEAKLHGEKKKSGGLFGGWF